MLPRSQRLVAAADHRLVARRGRRGRGGSLVAKCVLEDAASSRPARLAVVVPKAAGSAPVRNRLRRRLQNLAVTRLIGLPGGSRTVVRAEPPATLMTFQALGSALDAALDSALRPGARR